MKHCPKCDEDLPLSEFGICRSRSDGLNLYCKPCIRIKVIEFREKKRAYLKRTPEPLPRKKCAVARPIWHMRLKPRDAVLLAIKRGATSQAEIQRATRLYMDPLTDAIADLYSESRLDRAKLKMRIYELAA